MFEKTPPGITKIVIQLTTAEKEMFKTYAKVHGVTTKELFRWIIEKEIRYAANQYGLKVKKLPE